jgi:two-component system sensor histidine kinase PilS (NtrC family)
MEDNSFIHYGRLRRLQIFRLLLITLLLGALLVFEFIWPQQTSKIPASIYSYIAFTYLLTIFYALRLKKVRNPRGFIYRQLLVDATLIAILLYLTGGFYSLFFPLFYFIILGGAIYLARQQVLSLLFYCTFLYLLVIFFHVNNPLPQLVQLQPLMNSTHKIVSRLFFNLAPFYLTAFILQLIAEERLDTIQRLQRVTSDLKEFKDLNRHIVSSINSGLITTDQRLVINSINQAGRTILDRKPEEILYRPLGEVISLPLPDQDGASPPRQRFETVYYTPDGKRRILGFSFTPLKKNQQRSLGWILIFQDLSQAKEIEQRLQEARKMAAIGRLAAGFAHEIRNPLAAITGSIEILGRDLPRQDETHHRLLEIILRESTRMNNLISDFLSFSRQENRKQTSTDLLAQLRDIVFLFRAQFPDLRFRESYHRESFFILANPEQIEQILWNILKNATEVLTDGGEITISSRPATQETSRETETTAPDGAGNGPVPAGIEIEICDNGPGIGQETVDKIFEPFFTTKENGTGLGLYIVFQLTRINHGAIEISPKKENGKGTSARLRFPAARPAVSGADEGKAADEG